MLATTLPLVLLLISASLSHGQTGSDIQFTTNPANERNPAWSPDGRWIATVSYRSDNENLWVKPVAGGAGIQVTDDPADDRSPSWSPDGTKLLFVSNRGGNPNLWTISPFDGEATATQITTAADSVNDSGPVADWSPDGTTLAFTRTLFGRWDETDIWLVDVRDVQTSLLSMTHQGISGQVTRPSDGTARAHVPVQVKDESGSVLAEATTSRDGRYQVWVEPGSYSVLVGEVDEGAPRVNVSLTAGESRDGVDFGTGAPTAHWGSAQSQHLQHLQGEWLNRRYLEALQETKSPGKAYLTSPTTRFTAFFISREHSAYFDWKQSLSFHEGVFSRITGLEQTVAPNTFRVLFYHEQTHGPVTQNDQLRIAESGRGDTLTWIFDPLFSYGQGEQQIDFVRVRPDIDTFFNRVVIAGQYRNESGQEFVFKESGQAVWPDTEFVYTVGLDRSAILGEHDWFSLPGDCDNSWRIKDTYSFEWRNDRLLIFATDPKLNDPAAGWRRREPPLHVLVPE